MVSLLTTPEAGTSTICLCGSEINGILSNQLFPSAIESDVGAEHPKARAKQMGLPEGLDQCFWTLPDRFR